MKSKLLFKPLGLAIFFSLFLMACSNSADIESISDDNSGSSDGNNFHGPAISTYTSTYTYTSVEDSDLENMEAQQLTKIMGNGINLGNTMEATNNWIGYDSSDASVYETAWGQPTTTQAMFAAMKEAGFDSVRIPVAWTNTMDWSNGDFEINENYMERVAQVVDWALEEDLFVMINDHWDYQWWGLFSHDEELAFEIYENMWSQIGQYFKDYSYKLIFEGGNEELGSRFNDKLDSSVDSRLTGIDYSSSGSLSTSDCYKMITKVTQKFVDIIRTQGGNNAKRFLLIPGYDTDIGRTVSSAYKMPTDSSNSIQKLIISVHYYSPATYCILSQDVSWGQVATDWGSSSEYTSMNSDFKKMVSFIDKGYGVIIGEYGVAKYNGSKKDGMEEWLTNVLDNCDAYNYCPFLWDCNTFFKKSGTLGFTDSDVASVYSGRNYASESSGE
ncbi:MAG: glycoside hydrolase family 5 protein [Treponema sp.]|nr:glycoside hydrolase family 5 protein [Treponema sp.]